MTEVAGDNEFVIEPAPETKVHTPVPDVGVFPFNNVFGEEIQMVWLDPAFEIVGPGFTVIVMLETDGAQGELEIVHAKIFVPKPNAVISVFGSVGFVIVPAPETKVHKPVPIVGAFTVMVAVGTLKHTV